MAQQMLNTGVTGTGDTSSARKKLTFNGPPPFSSLDKVLVMEIPFRWTRPFQMNWHFVATERITVLPPYVGANRVMTSEERQSPVVCRHLDLGMMKLCFFARLQPGRPCVTRIKNTSFT